MPRRWIACRPLEARLVALASAYEARARGRAGEPCLPLAAVHSLQDGAYDPELVTALHTAVEDQLLPALPLTYSAAEQLALLTN